MATYEISVNITEEAYNKDGTTPQDRAITYISEYFQRHTSHSVDIIAPTFYPAAPTEDANASFTAPYSCDQSFSKSYGSIGEWYRDWLSCHSVENARDVNVLITGKWGEEGETLIDNDGHTYAGAEGGPKVANLPSTYERYEADPAHNAMQTVMHELGHGMMGFTSVNQHRVGAVSKRSTDRYWLTPMGLNGYGENVCGDWFDTTDSREWDVVLANCCEDWWDSPGEN